MSLSGDYPPTAFFGIHKGTATGVVGSYADLISKTKNYLNPKWEAFSNRAHAAEYARTGQIPSGATPLQPGEHMSPVRRAASADAGKLGSSMGRTPSLGAKISASAPSVVKANESPVKPATGVNGKTNSVPGPKGRVSPAPLGKPSNKPSTSANLLGGQRNASTVASTSGVGTSRKPTSVEVWTDGSCLGNGKSGARAAYGVYFGPDDPRNEAKRVPGAQTNNRGEVLGIIRALEIIDESVEHVDLYTDSQYAKNCLEAWLSDWIKRGGMTKAGKPAMNYPMLRYADALCKRRGDRLKIHYVKGHADNAGNNEADKLAQDAARSDEFVPARRDWDMERIALEKKPPIPAKGSAAAVKAEAPDVVSPNSQVNEGGSDYGYDDNDIEMGDEFDDEVVEVPKPAPPAPAAASSTTEVGASSAKNLKRTREEPRETANKTGENEIPDSDTERKASRKAAKRKAVQCPSCHHKFSVTLQK